MGSMGGLVGKVQFIEWGMVEQKESWARNGINGNGEAMGIDNYVTS